MAVEQAHRAIDSNGNSRAIVFARHETFHPRFGWLKKGFDRAAADASIFLREDAPVRLGVGKNMVRSLRYWCAAFKLLQDDQPTNFGRQLLGPDGWDPYLEDPASLWLLHWKLLESPNLATAWDFAFNQFRAVDFTVEDLFYQLCEWRDRLAPRVADSSLRKDINCLLRMYVSQATQGAVSEDSLDCPFASLGLIHLMDNARSYGFRVGAKPTLPAAVIVYACLHYANWVAPNLPSLPVAKLLYAQGSPGLVFRLTESALYEAIEHCELGGGGHGGMVAAEPFGVNDVAGQLEFFFRGEPVSLADDILNSYYAVR